MRSAMVPAFIHRGSVAWNGTRLQRRLSPSIPLWTGEKKRLENRKPINSPRPPTTFPHLKRGATVRPKTIVYFEWIIFGTLLVGALQSYLTWDRVAQAAAAYPGGARPLIIMLVFIYGLFATLALLVSRRRSKIAMWILIALVALGLYGLVEAVIRGQLGSDVITTALGEVVQGVALGLLFTPSARRWMRREDEKDEKLREVFN
jgi:hypothetical protein